MSQSGKPSVALVIGVVCALAVLLVETTDERAAGLAPAVRLEEPLVLMPGQGRAVVQRACFQKMCESINNKVSCGLSRTECAPISEWSHEYAPYFDEHEHQVPTSVNFDPFNLEGDSEESSWDESTPEFDSEPALGKASKKTMDKFSKSLQKAKKAYVKAVSKAEKSAEKETKKEAPKQPAVGVHMPPTPKSHKAPLGPDSGLGRLLHALRAEHEAQQGGLPAQPASQQKQECMERQCVAEPGSQELHCRSIQIRCGGAMQGGGGLADALKRMMGGGNSPIPFAGQPASQTPAGIPAVGGATGAGGLRDQPDIGKILKKLIKNGNVKVVRMKPQQPQVGPQNAEQKKLWKEEFGPKKASTSDKKADKKADKKKDKKADKKTDLWNLQEPSI